jgi:chromosome segregation ATPase
VAEDKKDLETREQQVAERERLLASKEDQIAEIVRLDAEISDKKKTLASVRAQITDERDVLERNRVDLETKKALLERLQAEAVSAAEALRKREEALRRREEAVATFRDALAHMAQSLSDPPHEETDGNGVVRRAASKSKPKPATQVSAAAGSADTVTLERDGESWQAREVTPADIAADVSDFTPEEFRKLCMLRQHCTAPDAEIAAEIRAERASVPDRTTKKKRGWPF